MNVKVKLLRAALGGVAVGAAGIELAWASASRIARGRIRYSEAVNPERPQWVYCDCELARQLFAVLVHSRADQSFSNSIRRSHNDWQQRTF